MVKITLRGLWLIRVEVVEDIMHHNIILGTYATEFGCFPRIHFMLPPLQYISLTSMAYKIKYQPLRKVGIRACDLKLHVIFLSNITIHCSVWSNQTTSRSLKSVVKEKMSKILCHLLCSQFQF